MSDCCHIFAPGRRHILCNLPILAGRSRTLNSKFLDYSIDCDCYSMSSRSDKIDHSRNFPKLVPTTPNRRRDSRWQESRLGIGKLCCRRKLSIGQDNHLVVDIGLVPELVRRKDQTARR
jgi:hypothetical protein